VVLPYLAELDALLELADAMFLQGVERDNGQRNTTAAARGLRLRGVQSSWPCVHTNWQQLGTETGHMACSEPNPQQLPKYAHWEAIVAPAGSTLLIADFSNAELCIEAPTSGDEAMRSAFGEGHDLHRDAARAIFGLGPDE